jgi:geranylgeranyl diphosphate synthase, type I
MASLVPPVFARFADDLDADLRATLPPDEHLPGLYGMLRYHLGWANEHLQAFPSPAGKRLRPVVCLLATEAMGGEYRLALPAASSVEIVHNFSLVHDDIEDNSPERRHRPTVWKLWGEPHAINAGDVLFALAFECLGRLARLGHPATVVLEAMNLLSLACRHLCEGQYLDISFECRDEVSEAEYYEMIAGKTASLLACAAQLGALIGSGSVEQSEPLRRFGFQLGLAFQIQDDILGIWGEESQTGKPRGDDLRQRKKTLPVIYGLAVAEGRARGLLASILQGQGTLSPQQLAEAEQTLEEVGARLYAEERASKHLASAILELDALSSTNPAIEELRSLASYLLGRQA